MGLNDSLRLSESLIANDMKLSLNHTSGKIIGQVTVDEIDKDGNILFSETTHNDITLGGSIFVLEQIFKRASSQDCTRFNIPSQMPIITTENRPGIVNRDNNNGIVDTSDDVRSEYISDEYIFGFMVGNGGESPSGIVSPRYESSSLVNKDNERSFLPLRIHKPAEGEPNPIDNNMDYYLKCAVGDADNGYEYYYYAKAFNGNPKIYTKWSDGSGPVEDKDKDGKIDVNVPILTYGEISLNICENDIREYFEKRDDGLENCYINQLGLVAGKPVWVQDQNGRWKKDSSGTYSRITNKSEFGKPDNYRLDFDDIHLVTTLNFKTKELSNNENTIKFTYKIYCL